MRNDGDGVDRSIDIRMVENCPNCKQGWGVPAHKAASTTPNHVRGVIDGIQSLRQQLTDKNVSGFTLTLKIAPGVISAD